jgi:hypothetical protein
MKKALSDGRASPLSLPGLSADDHSCGEFRRHRRDMGGRGPAHLGHDGNDCGVPGGRRPQRAWIGRGEPQEAAHTARNGYARPQKWLLSARGASRLANGRSRRQPVIARSLCVCRNWADCGPTTVASARTGVRAIADVLLRARSALHRPTRSRQIRVRARCKGQSGCAPPIARGAIR